VEEVACILCGKPGLPWREKADKFPPHERFRVVRCPACGLAWVSPRPGPEEIGRYYPDTYTWRPDSRGAETAVHRLERWYRFHLLRYETRQLLAGTDLGPGDAVLDVGCSSGDRMLVLKQAGLKPAGCDIGATADFARSITGLDVRRGTLEEARFEDGRFRAVTLHNVLEHVHDPRRLLAEARRVLAPGGWLVVQSPSASSLQARIFGRRWAALDVPRDLYYYTPALLARLLEGAGFEVAAVVHRTSFLHPPTAAVSLAPWADPQRFWNAEAAGAAGAAGGKAGPSPAVGLWPAGGAKASRACHGVALARRVAWAAVTMAVAPAVWLESALGAGAIPTVFARKNLKSQI
jgi:SAM-dependent methyltransferase